MASSSSRLPYADARHICHKPPEVNNLGKELAEAGQKAASTPAPEAKNLDKKTKRKKKRGAKDTADKADPPRENEDDAS